MKKLNTQDERLVLQKRKIGNDAFGIVFYGLLISVLIQQFLIGAPFSQYAVELILFMVASFYVVIRNIFVGNNLFQNNNGQKMVIINSVVSGLTIAVITTTLNTINFGLEKMGGFVEITITSFITFACGLIASFIVFELLYQLNKRRQKQIDDMYKDIDE
ncbi:MAG: conserved rane protein of unknown function [Firmicutes bacterium]|nr:conserved rane protein of unknown function [Bacillota bacterium]